MSSYLFKTKIKKLLMTLPKAQTHHLNALTGMIHSVSNLKMFKLLILSQLSATIGSNGKVLNLCLMNIIKKQRSNVVKLREMIQSGGIISIDLMSTKSLNILMLSCTTMMKCFKLKSLTKIPSKKSRNSHSHNQVMSTLKVVK